MKLIRARSSRAPCSEQGHEAALGDAHGALAVDQAEALGDLPVLLEGRLTGHRHAGCAPAPPLHVLGFAGPIGAVGGGQVGEGEQLLAQTGFEGFLLLLEHRHLLLDGVAPIAQGLHLGAVGRFAAADQLAHLAADAVAFGLQITALLLKITLLAGDQLQGREIECHAPPPELLDDQLGVVAQQALIQHGSRGEGACSLRTGAGAGRVEGPQSTCTTSFTSGIASRSLRSMPIFRVMVLLGQLPQAPCRRTFTVGPSISTISTLPPSAIR